MKITKNTPEINKLLEIIYFHPDRDENGSDTNGYYRYHICFHIFGRIRIRIRIMSIMSRDENGTDIFRPYSRPNLFRGV